MHLSVQHDIVVLRLALVRAPRPGLAPAEDSGIDGGRREVIPGWDQRLDEVHGVGRFGEDVAVEVDLDGAGGGEDVDALGGVFGVDVDGGVFFVPLVWRREGQMGQVEIGSKS